MNVRNILHKVVLLLMAAMLMNSCDMMKEDLSDCPTGLYVNFVYDYNIQRADMFKDHVGGLTNLPSMDITSISRSKSWLPITNTVLQPLPCRRTGVSPLH